jgi:uncharacterized protein GlcG (DUF336 family)
MTRVPFGGFTIALGAGLALAPLGCTEGRLENAGNTAASGQALALEEVELVLARAVSAARAAGAPAAVAVVDREGEVLGVFVTPPRDVNGDGALESIGEANIRAAISKAGTAALFSSEGEAFSTRTAYFIVQGSFPPGVRNTPGGPLFGVQDSSLASSDVRPVAFDAGGDAAGGGISGELGGLPLFKSGAPVGGVGVDTADVLVPAGGAPTLASPVMNPLDESIALAATAPDRAAPLAIRATNVFVDGLRFPFAEATARAAPLIATTTAGLALAGAGAVDARFPVRASPLPPEVRVAGQFGIRPARRQIGRLVAPLGGPFASVDRASSVTFGADYVFRGVPVTAAAAIEAAGGVTGERRHASIDSLEPPAPLGLTAAEVDAIIAAGVRAGDAASGAIRLPRGASARVHVAVVDARGNILGSFRMGDGTLFSFDVAVQKARTAAFFSTDGFAATPRGLGFLAQPFFPPGIDGTEPGPLARLRDLANRGLVTAESPPSLTLIRPPPRPPADAEVDDDDATAPGVQDFDDFAGLAVSPTAAQVDDVRARLAATGGFSPLADRPDVGFVSPGLESGLQTFPGAVPLYKGGRLVGAVGASGDGVDEDDLVSWYAAKGYEPTPGTRIDEVPEHVVATTLAAKVDALAAALEAHPDAAIAAVYAPLFRREAARARDRFSRGLEGVRIPYVKLPRGSDER